jgi:uncharacterized membrane protein
MPALRGRIAGGASIVLLGAVPFVLYHLIVGYAPPWLIATVAATQIATIAWLASGKFAARYRAARYRAALVASLLAIAAALLLLSGWSAHTFGLVMAGCCHAIAYSSLLIWFATSLRPGGEPVVTVFARRLRQTMPDKVVRYTRLVTIAWCVFFTAQLAVSAALLVLAPTVIWSAFVTLLNVPLLVAMVLVEFGCRLILFRHEPHTGLMATVSALRRPRFMPVSRP